MIGAWTTILSQISRSYKCSITMWLCTAVHPSVYYASKW